MKKIIVIGAGIGGLTAGALLAKKGHDVTIFESHGTPGGYIAGFRRKGFYFESGTLSFESSNAVFKMMKDIGVPDKVEFVRQKSGWVSPDFEGAPETYEEFKDMLRSAYPDEGTRLDRYFSETDRMVRVFKPFMAEKKRFLDILFSGIRLLRVYRRYGGTPLSKYTAGFFPEDTVLYRFFSSLGYPEMAAWILGGAIVTLFDDYWTVKNGMQSWADVMAERYRDIGGKLILNSYVDKILTRHGAAVGVSCGDKRYEADYVISACDYKKTFLELLDNRELVPSELLEKIGKNAVSEGFFTVYLGLGLSGDRLRSYMKVPHVMFFDDHPGMDIHDSSDEAFFEKTSIGLYSPSLINPALAPAEKSSLMVQATVPYRWMDNWGGGDRKRYLALKERVKDTMVKKASSVIPGLTDLIEFEDAATPLTYERYTHNTDGATSAWSWNPANMFHKSFQKVFVDTPVKNLLIGSCWATQIGGIPGALNAAYRCVKKIG